MFTIHISLTASRLPTALLAQRYLYLHLVSLTEHHAIRPHQPVASRTYKSKIRLTSPPRPWHAQHRRNTTYTTPHHQPCPTPAAEQTPLAHRAHARTTMAEPLLAGPSRRLHPGQPPSSTAGRRPQRSQDGPPRRRPESWVTSLRRQGGRLQAVLGAAAARPRGDVRREEYALIEGGGRPSCSGMLSCAFPDFLRVVLLWMGGGDGWASSAFVGSYEGLGPRGECGRIVVIARLAVRRRGYVMAMGMPSCPYEMLMVVMEYICLVLLFSCLVKGLPLFSGVSYLSGSPNFRSCPYLFSHLNPLNAPRA